MARQTRFSRERIRTLPCSVQLGAFIPCPAAKAWHRAWAFPPLSCESCALSVFCTKASQDSPWRNFMSPNHTPGNSEEFSRRGQEIYDRDVRPALRLEDEDKFVAIDIESGNYE